MADISRQTSPRTAPLSTSPNRPSPLSRPHWPYTTYSHRSASSMSSSMNSIHSSPLGNSWDHRAPTPNAGAHVPSGALRRASSSSGNTQQGENTRHWSFTAFEWIVRDVHRLRDYVEIAASSLEAGDSNGFDVLKDSPMLGDGKFKLEIGAPSKSAPLDITETPISEIRTQPHSLSLYITSTILEYAHTDYEVYTSMFAGIKCQEDRAGERGARPDWVWEHWQNDWTFREDSEVWECPLPTLSALLENPRIRGTDSFVICVQIHSPTGPFFPHQPSASYVPKDLLNGLEAMLDNANTGDVQFICLERKEEGEDTPLTESPEIKTPPSRRSSTSSSDSSPSHARRRIIYAHSEILTHRSEYFATMLNSSFSENGGQKTPGERKIYTIVVEEADFVTVYWLLKWVYGNWLLFKENDNPKAAIEGVGAGWSAKSLESSSSSDEWAWKTFTKGFGSEIFLEPGGLSDSRSVASAESVHSGGAISARNTTPGHAGSSKGEANSRTPRAPPLPKVPLSTSSGGSASRPPHSPTRRASAASTGLTVPLLGNTSSPSARGSKAVPLSPITTSASTFPTTPHFPISPHTQRQRSRPSGTKTPDPHPHPTPQPAPASALSMYQVAHRYAMPGLASLSLEHMMSTITPQSSFALLLASTLWDELHALVEDYVIDKWNEVSVSPEFEQCCQEVAAGEWGPEGGKTLMGLFRRLRSPNALAFNRG